jgi:hypothetical protein
MERTLILVKPDAMHEGWLARSARLERRGLRRCRRCRANWPSATTPTPGQALLRGAADYITARPSSPPPRGHERRRRAPEHGRHQPAHAAPGTMAATSA